MGKGGRSPDGAHVIYDAVMDNDWDSRGIFLMKADGTDRTGILTVKGEENLWPSFSPDGSKILFRSDRGLPIGSLVATWVMEANGSNQARIIEAAGSPDGRPMVGGSYSPLIRGRETAICHRSTPRTPMARM